MRPMYTPYVLGKFLGGPVALQTSPIATEVKRLSAETIKRSISGCRNLVKILSLYKRALIAYNYGYVNGDFLLLFGSLLFGQD